jgi:endonuclease G
MFRRSWMAVALAIGLVLSVPTALLAQASTKKDHLVLGNPSGAKADLEDPDKTNFLMEKDFFALSYNSEKGTPNWVSWRLVKEDFMPSLKRADDFHPDTTDLPDAFFRVQPKNYELAGFDRGHMCPNGDRDVSKESADATFVMTNMVPQSPALNRQSWKMLEEHCRDLAKADNELYIVAGPLGSGGHGVVEKKRKGVVIEEKPVFATTLANGKISVPAQCFKVVLVVERGDGSLAERLAKNGDLFAVIMANDQTPKKWKEHLVPIQEVENLTKCKFFSDVPADVMNALRKKSSAQSRRLDPGRLFFCTAWLATPTRQFPLAR